MQCNGDTGSAPRWPEDGTHHAVVEPLRDEVVQQFGVDQLSVVQVEGPEGEHHELWGDDNTGGVSKLDLAPVSQHAKC